MKYPGQPKDEAPSWYSDRGQSHIEKKFSDAVDELAGKIESEHWFGDKKKHGRYRVDFILKDARLIIELDGHKYHSTPEQLEKDAIRQRYLTRAGYTVIRFTGREIVRNVDSCVNDVRTIYSERMQREPAKYRAMYIDYEFFIDELKKTVDFYTGLYPERNFVPKNIENTLSYLVEWLHEKSYITSFIFHLPQHNEILKSINGNVKEYEKGEIRINTIPDDLYSVVLGEHLESYSHFFDEFLIVADDTIYIEPLRQVLSSVIAKETTGSHNHYYIPNCKLLRKGNEDTNFKNTELVKVKWQRLSCPLGASFGLSLNEM
ncbi:hypothetical protein A8B79_06205 [Balneola sp. EhC07]|uniref:endonuclease domain-containing protein n=1 Tax=Balneola sp. EhC07 TaxID=1849360 RepID=UPI0007F4FAF8|nr:DUF559 domain-containing protein [Balneola sp. EhC07]OAN61062.1 hypothetical protein A8B79_06205 [Balneola sp. EhC07]